MWRRKTESLNFWFALLMLRISILLCIRVNKSCDRVRTEIFLTIRTLVLNAGMQSHIIFKWALICEEAMTIKPLVLRQWRYSDISKAGSCFILMPCYVVWLMLPPRCVVLSSEMFFNVQSEFEKLVELLKTFYTTKW